MVKITQYPYRVELPMSRGFISITAWLESAGIDQYAHESYLLEGRTRICYGFRRQQDAVVFALKWA
jgi:hypothetical protein